MSDNTHFVVGVPTYNNEDSIEGLVETFNSQTRPPDELIFCDASTDQTPEILRELQAEVPFELTIMKQRGDGVADAYNQILEHIHDDYDIFGTLQTTFTVDDTWVESAIRIHEEHPNIGIVNAHRGIHQELDMSHPAYFSGRCFTAKAGVLEDVDGWDMNFLRGEDWDIRIRLEKSDVRSFASDELQYESTDFEPSVSLKKSIRKPTSLQFLAKYGWWYLKYHPKHVIADALGVGLITSLAIIFINPVLGISMTLLLGLIYLTGYNVTRGDVQGSHVIGPLKKAFFDGIGVLYTAKFLTTRTEDWNMSGFEE